MFLLHEHRCAWNVLNFALGGGWILGLDPGAALHLFASDPPLAFCSPALAAFLSQASGSAGFHLH